MHQHLIHSIICSNSHIDNVKLVLGWKTLSLRRRSWNLFLLSRSPLLMAMHAIRSQIKSQDSRQNEVERSQTDAIVIRPRVMPLDESREIEASTIRYSSANELPPISSCEFDLSQSWCRRRLAIDVGRFSCVQWKLRDWYLSFAACICVSRLVGHQMQTLMNSRESWNLRKCTLVYPAGVNAHHMSCKITPWTWWAISTRGIHRFAIPLFLPTRTRCSRTG